MATPIDRCWNVVNFFGGEIAETVHYSHDQKKFGSLSNYTAWISHPKSAMTNPQHLAHNVANFIQIGSLSADL